jgi:DNA-binding transcriptional MerR regulator
MSGPSQNTVGEIARRTNQPIHRIEYLIRSRGIEPASRAGNARVFAEPDVDLIAQELARIDADRAKGVR